MNLIERAHEVPVGDDQTQNIEFMRDTAKSFNTLYGKDVFPLPEARLASFGRVMSLRDGLSKMSKSDLSSLSRINLSDDCDTLMMKIRKAKTDSIAFIYFDRENRPEVSNLLEITAELSDQSLEKVCSDMEGKTSDVLKQTLAEVCIGHLKPIREELLRIQDDRVYIESVLSKGRDKASEIALKTITQVKEVVGLC